MILLEKYQFVSFKIVLALVCILMFESCDKSCRNDDCPANQVFLKFEVVDTLGRNCVTINPDLESFLLSSNDFNQDDVVVIRTGDLGLKIKSDIKKYLIKYSEMDSIILDLNSQEMTVTCCDKNIDVLLDYELTDSSTDNMVCSNCVFFELLIPSCD